MLEIRLLLIFFACAALILINGAIGVKLAKTASFGKITVLIPITADTADVELIIRSCVYKLAEQSSGIEVIFCNFGADKETLLILERLMQKSCKYSIVSSEEYVEKVCKAAKNMV
ncbi:MAG: hypothetical protein J6C96_10615 [Oscillospiraceae bacterium]|nr:hypothetical protein [Oscillospiraceae bacterium]